MHRIFGILKKNRAFTFWMIVAFLVVLLEIYFTGESASVSSARSKGVLCDILDLLRIEYTEITIKTYDGVLRKCAHFAIFFALGFSVTAALNCQRRLPRIPLVIVFGGGLAIADEVRQYFVPGRATELRDMLIDFSGVLVGILAASASIWVIRRTRARWLEKRQDKRG